ncbi:MAG: PQQ-dependent sugar dehydrogenase, partial [Candidatus Acidiferrales bacterium]
PEERTAEAQGAAIPGLPTGFKLSVYAEGLGRARFMAFGPAYAKAPAGKPDGKGWVLYVGTNERSGKVWALPDYDGDGRADENIIFAEGLYAPHSVVWKDGWLYIGEGHQVIRARDTSGDLRSDEKEVVVAGLPRGGNHFTRTVGFGPDGGLYVSVGSSCNACIEEDARRATILRFNPDGSGMEIFARGLRNAVGFTWHPATKDMWAVVNGRDLLGDDLPPEELNLVRRGDDHGWPYCYGNRVPDPDFGSRERCARTQPDTFEMQAHSAPLGLAFYTGSMFPAEYRGDLFIAFHGSWNRSVPTGYKVVRVRFKDGRPVSLENFVDVWYKRGRVEHRPVDVAVGPDGALYISDDSGGTIFRVTYEKR